MARTKSNDGMYHIGNQKYRKLEGSRAEVWHHTAHHTSGGLKRSALKQNEEGRIVSRAKSKLGKSQKHLGSHLQPKGSGVFGSNKTMKKSMKKAKKSSNKTRNNKRGGSSCDKGGSSKK